MALLDPGALSLDLLKTLVVFSDAGTVDETARRLGLTQAGVSLQLKKLEEQVGEELFRFQGRKKALTDYARDLCQSIAPPLRDLEHRLAEVSRRSPDPARRTLRVGGRAEILSRALDLLDFPGRVIMQAMTTTEATSALREDRLDVALLAEPPDSGELISKVLFEDTVVLAIPRAWGEPARFDALESGKSRLLEKPVVGYKVQPPFLDEIARRLGGDLDVKYVCEDWTAVGKLVSSGKAWAAMPSGVAPADALIVDVPTSVLKASRYHLVYGRHWRGLDRHFKRT